jgi:hypothetical protein
MEQTSEYDDPLNEFFEFPDLPLASDLLDSDPRLLELGKEVIDYLDCQSYEDGGKNPVDETSEALTRSVNELLERVRILEEK